ncbi:M56 family metallopeptidase [Prosthecobacter fluviatilis]|uniref:M56 family metallopeptidase n=1 Tax=Prosthecobacter fluviatilis TaxID=445931 RepID=A0ABW0KTQ0_9BACT
MNTLTHLIELWLQSLMLLTWKGALLTLVAGAVVLLLRHHLSAAWRHGLWLLVLLRFTVPDLGLFSGSLDGLVDVPALIAPGATPHEVESGVFEAPLEQGGETSAIMASNAPQPLMSAAAQALPASSEISVLAADQAPSWSLAQKLFAVWLCGALTVVLAMVALHLRLQRRIRRDASEAFSEISSVLLEACRMAGVRRVPRLLVTEAVRAPSLFGLLNPVILLPRQVAAGRDAATLKLILLHELAHLKRHDLWAQVLSSCVIAVHWFNPLVWMAARRLRAEAEMAADAHALSCTDVTEAHRFGEMLLGFTRFGTTGWMIWLASATLLGISENKNDLRRRIEGLMDIARGRRTRWLVGMAAFIVLAAVGLTRSPAEDAKKVTAETPADNLATTVVRGIVVDEKDKPVSGAVVKISINQLSRSESLERVTGADGKFVFEDVPKAASLNLRARHSEYAESNFIVFSGVSVSQERRLVLPGVSWIRGKITDKRDGRPIKDARVFFGVENKVAIVSRYDWKHPFAHTNEAGEYRLPVKVADVNGIIVRAWAPDMTVQSRAIKFSGHDAEFDAALEPAQRVPGKVVDALGEPVKDAMVWVVEDAVRLDESFKPITLEMMRSSDRVNMTQGKFFISLDYSKGDGSVQMPEADPLLKDKLWVVAMHPKAGFARMRAADLKAGVVFRLEKWVSMSGKIIRSDGSPLADATLFIHAKGDPDLLARQDTLKIVHNIKVTTDIGGAYKIDHLLPGATFNGVTIDGVKIKKEYLPVGPITVGTGAQKVRQITLGMNLAIRREGGVRAVQGRIVLPEGFALRGDDYSCHFSIISQGLPVSIMTTPDKEGRYITEDLPPGTYELSVSVIPRNTGMEMARDVGRWVRFQITAGADQAPLQVPDIVITKEDLTPKPRSASDAAMLESAVFSEGPEGKIEVTTIDAEEKPVPGVKIEILDLVDYAHVPMNLASAQGRSVQMVSDDHGKAILSFPRNPAAGKRASGVQVAGTAPDGAKARITTMMDCRKYKLRVYPETPVRLAVSTPATHWVASTSAGLLQEKLTLEGGELKGRLALEHRTHFIVQGTTAEGRVLFSQAIGTQKDRGQEVRETLKLEPGVEIEGKIEGLPADDEGTGGVVANVYVKPQEVTNEVMKGNPPNVPWTAWAPVGPDGRFRFKGMPRGMVTLRGLGKGWMTTGPLNIDSTAIVDIRGSAEKTMVTLSTKPCIRRSLRVLLPDGSPAVGATVQVEAPGIGLLSTSRENMHAEDAGRLAQFMKTGWMSRLTVANEKGEVMLENRPAGRTYCQVFWMDPKTLHPRWGTATVSFEDTEKSGPLEIKVAEK